MKQNIKSTREIALEILLQVMENGELSHIALRKTLSEYEKLEKNDKAFITRMVEGTIEKVITLDFIINQYSKIKVKKMKPVIRNVLRLSVYQIMFMDAVPDHAICNEAVTIIKRTNFRNLSSFVNGVLRTVIRQRETIEYPNEKQDKTRSLSVRYSVPEWMIRHFEKDYGEAATIDILKNLQQKETACLTVRANVSKMPLEEIMHELVSQGIEVSKSYFANHALRLKNYPAIQEIHAFQKGLIQVQDISSMLVGQVSGVSESDYCIDVCAAPGGKSLHLADLLRNSGKVCSYDISEKKVNLIRENIQRTGFTNIQSSVQDALIFKEEDQERADLVIADVPCSGMGILSKKPDIKYHLQEKQIEELANLSQKILSNVVKYIKSGGTLIFSTCTMNKTENDMNREWLMNHYDLEPVSIEEYLSEDLLKMGNNRETAKQGYLQLFVAEEYDGFYLSKFIKK